MRHLYLVRFYTLFVLSNNNWQIKFKEIKERDQNSELMHRIHFISRFFLFHSIPIQFLFICRDRFPFSIFSIETYTSRIDALRKLGILYIIWYSIDMFSLFSISVRTYHMKTYNENSLKLYKICTFYIYIYIYIHINQI